MSSFYGRQPLALSALPNPSPMIPRRFGKARATAMNISCATADFPFQAYFNDSKGYFPTLAGPDNLSWGYNYGSWYKPIRPYLGISPINGNPKTEKAQALVCPYTFKYGGIYRYNLYATRW